MDAITICVTIFCSVLASSGFWSYLIKRKNRDSSETKMLIGLAHDRILYLGMQYIERGWVTQGEYENLHEYLYVPYSELGGNGTAKKVMEEVNKLEIKGGN